jgi:hypothetical protein
VFFDNVGALSVYSVIAGNAGLGLSQPNQIAVAEKLLDSHSLYLTGNTCTMYSIGHLDLDKFGSTIVEAALELEIQSMTGVVLIADLDYSERPRNPTAAVHH